jgi:hypothetical protein
MIENQMVRLADNMEKTDTPGIILVEGGVFANGIQRELQNLLVFAMKTDKRLIDLFSAALAEVVTVQ